MRKSNTKLMLLKVMILPKNHSMLRSHPTTTLKLTKLEPEKHMVMDCSRQDKLIKGLLLLMEIPKLVLFHAPWETSTLKALLNASLLNKIWLVLPAVWLAEENLPSVPLFLLSSSEVLIKSELQELVQTT